MRFLPLLTYIYFFTGTTLDLKAMESDANSTNSGFITVRLTADDDIGAIAISNAREDSERSGLLISVDGADAIQVIDASVASQSTFLMALGSVVSKLATFVELVDKAAKVSTRSCVGKQFLT
jgi:hypothetical protein